MASDLQAQLLWFARELERSAEEVRQGSLPSPIAAGGRAGIAELCAAFESLTRALVIRERAQPWQTEHDVLLALEELAKEQAAEMAARNEQLRQAKEALEVQNRLLQRQNAELVRAGRLKDEFLATMSHELRTPLSAIIGYSEMLLEQIPGPMNPEQTSYVDDVLRSGRHLLDIINDILDMAKVDAGRMDFQREPVDLSQVARAALDIARSMALRKEQQLVLEDEGGVMAVGDAQRIRQIALNLLSNAVKFTPPGGKIVLAVRAVPHGAELSVRDQGIGIDPSHHELIFEAFRQVDGSHTREHQGTGLGLTLVRKFCQAMGGTVSVNSRSGEGAQFIVRLPALSAVVGAPGETA